MDNNCNDTMTSAVVAIVIPEADTDQTNVPTNTSEDQVDSTTTAKVDMPQETITMEVMNTKSVGNDETGVVTLNGNYKNNDASNGHNHNQNNNNDKKSPVPVKKNVFYNQQPFDEYFVPVNEHRKFIRGEKLYLTMDKRDKRGFGKHACFCTTFVVLTVAVVIAILAAVGVLFKDGAQHENAKNSVSSRQLGPNLKSAGISIMTSNYSKFHTDLITDPPIVFITTQAPITTKAYSKYEVPNALEANVVITNMQFIPELANKSTSEYKKFVEYFEMSLRTSLFDFETLENSPATIFLRVIDIQPGSIRVKFRILWVYVDDNYVDKVITTEDEILSKLLANVTEPYELDPKSTNVTRVNNICEINNNNCTGKCSFDVISLRFVCTSASDNTTPTITTTDATITTTREVNTSPIDVEIVTEMVTEMVTEPVKEMVTEPVTETVTESETEMTMIEEVEATTMVAESVKRREKLLNYEIEEDQSQDQDQEQETTTIDRETLIPVGNDALNHENPIEENLEMGIVIDKENSSETQVPFNETIVDSPIIELMIVEKDPSASASETPLPSTTVKQTSQLNDEVDFFKELDDDDKFSALSSLTLTEIPVTEETTVINDELVENMNTDEMGNVSSGVRATEKSVIPIEEPSTCSSSEFQCLNGTSKRNETTPCIAIEKRCDSFSDCGDNSDETNCLYASKKFKCSSNLYEIERGLVCDGVTHCLDNSDENNCENWICAADEFSCGPKKQCIPMSLRCNGKRNCFSDGRDEMDCLPKCSEFEFHCVKEDICIPKSLKCNGQIDCSPSGQDEQVCDCLPNEFKCKNFGGCINKLLVCDGIEHCGDLSDEWNCVRTPDNTNLSIVEINFESDSWLPICSTNWVKEYNHVLCEKLGYYDTQFSMSVPMNNRSVRAYQYDPYFRFEGDSAVDLLQVLNVVDDCQFIEAIQCRTFNCGNHPGTGRVLRNAKTNHQYLTDHWPSIVVVYNDFLNIKCIGTLITPKWVITANSCLDNDKYTEAWKVQGGLPPSIQINNVKRFTVCPYAVREEFYYDNDLVLIEMTTVFDLSDKLNPICLPDNMNQNELICLTAMWKEYYYSMPQIKDMDYIITTKYNETDCRKLFVNVDKKICTQKSGEEVNKCNDNQGAPLMCFAEDTDVLELQGLLSSDPTCNYTPGTNIYNKIDDKIREWIIQTVGIKYANVTRLRYDN